MISVKFYFESRKTLKRRRMSLFGHVAYIYSQSILRLRFLHFKLCCKRRHRSLDRTSSRAVKTASGLCATWYDAIFGIWLQFPGV